jgi:1-deoxy-D-xylulose-5-phosphate reductoisomerase
LGNQNLKAFLNGQLSFPGIWHTVERVMTAHRVIAHPTLEALIEADAWARREAGSGF